MFTSVISASMLRKKFIIRCLATLPLLFILFSVTAPLTVTVAHAQKSYSGDEKCGAWDPSANGGKGAIKNPCTLSSGIALFRDFLVGVISLGIPFLFVIIAIRIIRAYKARVIDGNANALKEATKEIWNGVLGLLIILLLVAGALGFLFNYIGVKDEFFKPLKLFGDALFPHAYAADKYLPNPLKVNNLYDFLLQSLRLTVRFFIFPALIAMWVWTGFSFVLAQGAPDKITKAKQWLIWAFACTLIIFLLQAFLSALQGSVQKILPSSATSQSTSQATGITSNPSNSRNTTNTSGAQAKQQNSVSKSAATGQGVLTDQSMNQNSQNAESVWEYSVPVDTKNDLSPGFVESSAPAAVDTQAQEAGGGTIYDACARKYANDPCGDNGTCNEDHICVPN